MTRSLLALITLTGFNIMFWGCMGVFRLIHERARHVRRPASAMVLATLSASLLGVLLLDLSHEPLVRLVVAILSSLRLEPASAAGVTASAAAGAPAAVLATVIPVSVVLCGATASYLGARLFAVRHFAEAIALTAVLYWLGMAFLTTGSLGTGLAYFYGNDLVPWVLLGLAISSCSLGLLLARRRARLAHESERLQGAGAPRRLTPNDVAVLIAAHNEESSLPPCLDALSKIVAMRNVFVASDGSTDNTVEVAREWGCNVLDIQPNRGKARALAMTIDHFTLCDRYEAVLLLDADSEIDEHYLERALPLFDDPAVAAVAGHAIPKSYPHRRPRWSMLFIAYRIRLYRITQALLRYGQTWRSANVSFIVPGFASMYRCSVLPSIDITAPGLIIEDFNMTFELHHKRLGQIAYSPGVRCTSHEPRSLRDYWKQVRRWNLGLWQTVRLHGIWPSLFCLSLGTFVAEMLLQSLTFLSVPFILAWFSLAAGEPLTLWLLPLGTVQLTLADMAIGVFLADYAMTLLVAVVERKPILMLYGLGFTLLRWVDAFLFLYTLPLAFIEKSDGRWVSPART